MLIPPAVLVKRPQIWFKYSFLHREVTLSVSLYCTESLRYFKKMFTDVHELPERTGWMGRRSKEENSAATEFSLLCTELGS